MSGNGAARRLLNHQLVPNNTIRRLRMAELMAAVHRDLDVEAEELADLAPGGSTGSLSDGWKFDGDDITVDTTTSPATFTGSGALHGWPPIEVQSGVYAVSIALNNGVVTFYISAEDGKLYRGAGAVVSDQNGETFNIGDSTAVSYIKAYAEAYSSPQRADLFFGMNYLSLGFVGADNTELLANADFETGTLTNWTAAGAGTWTADTTTVYRGSKSAKCVLSGTSAHTLTSDRIVIGSESDIKLLIVYQYSTLVGWTDKHVDIKWYDSAVGGSLVQTDTVDLGNAAANTWLYKILTAHAPTAASYEVVLSATTSSGTPSIFFDGLRLRDMNTGGGHIEIRDTIKGALNGTVSSTAAPSASDANQGRALNPYWRDDTSGQISSLCYGDYAGYVIAPDDINENTLYARILKANSLGTKGTFRLIAKIRTTNNGDASNYTATVRFKWNGSTVFTGASLGLSANANRQTTGFYEFTVKNINSASAQELTLDEQVTSNKTIAQMGSGQTPTPLNYWATASVATTADVAVALTVQKSTNDADFDVELLGVWADGPYPAR